MKTTIELPNDLFERSKAVARRENSTLKALIEEGLRLALRARTRKRAAPFALLPFERDGLSPEFVGAGWEKIRNEIYRDRGCHPHPGLRAPRGLALSRPCPLRPRVARCRASGVGPPMALRTRILRRRYACPHLQDHHAGRDRVA
jgi:hypothetical protein